MKNIVISALISALLGLGIYTMEMSETSLEKSDGDVTTKAENSDAAIKKVEAKPMEMSAAEPVDAQTGKYRSLQFMVAKLFPGIKIKEFKETGISGVLEFSVGAQVFYVSEDGRFLIKGDVFDLATQENLTDQSEQVARVSTLESFGDKNLLVYKAKDEKHFVTVFTDIDCPYCRVLHEEVQQYLTKGISVKYVFLPFKGKKSYQKSVSVWCSKDPQEAMNSAKKGRRIRSSTCEHPIDMHMALGQEFGVRGTPAIVLEDGSMIPGYRPVKDVAAILNGTAK